MMRGECLDLLTYPIQVSPLWRMTFLESDKRPEKFRNYLAYPRITRIFTNLDTNCKGFYTNFKLKTVLNP